MFSETNTNVINMNHQIHNDEWSEYEKSLGHGTELITNCLADFVSCIANKKDTGESVQTSHPATFPEGWDDYRKTKKDKKKGIKGFADLYCVEPNLSLVYISEIPAKKKQDQMKLSNSVSKYREEIGKLSMEGQNIPSPINNGLVDIKILDLISFMNRLIKSSKHKVNTNMDIIMGEAYEAFFGIGKILENISNIDVIHHTTCKLMKIPEIIIQPLRTKYNEFTSIFNFDFSIASTKYPRLFYSTNFDNIFPAMSVKPYESQKQILEFVNSNISNPFICVMNTLMGMGKTWVAGYIGKLIDHHNSYSNGISKTFIYTCPETLKSVRYVVGKILYRHKVSFAIAFVKSGKVVIKKQNNCKKDGKKPTVILAGVQATLELLKSDYYCKEEKFTIDKSNCIVFFDENTIGMDKEPSPMVPYLAEFYHLLPPQTIFSSATHPNIESMEKLQTFANLKYHGIVFKTIDYSKVLIGTQLNKLNGEMFIPHSLSNNSNTLKRFIKFIENNLMYKKFYTIPLVRAMYEKIVSIGLELPNNLIFDNWMGELNHRNQEAVQNLGVEYLKFILSQSNTQSDAQSNELENMTIIAKFNNISHSVSSIDFNDLIKTAQELSGQTFISCANPQMLLKNKFENYFTSVLSAIGVKDFETLYNKYKKQKELQEKQQKSNAKSKGGDKITKLERAREEGTNDCDISYIGIPPQYLLRKGTGVNIGCVNWDSIIADDFVKFAGLFGIFIYSEETDSSYNNFVINSISNGMAVYVFADSTLNYGNSFPFNNGIITQDMSVHSDKTLLQLMARAGRPGVSHTAIIYADDTILEKINDAIYNPDYLDLEFSNLSLCVDIAIQKNIEEKQKLQEKEEQMAQKITQYKIKEEKEAMYKAKLEEMEKQIKISKLKIEYETQHETQLKTRWNHNPDLETSRSENTWKRTSYNI